MQLHNVQSDVTYLLAPRQASGIKWTMTKFGSYILKELSLRHQLQRTATKIVLILRQTLLDSNSQRGLQVLALQNLFLMENSNIIDEARSMTCLVV
jgi:hypothetical protein